MNLKDCCKGGRKDENRNFSTRYCKNKSYLQTTEEEKVHRRQETEALEAIKSQILFKDVIGILEVKRYLEIEEKNTSWITFIITPDADDSKGLLRQRVAKSLSGAGYGPDGRYLAGMFIVGTGGSVLEVSNVLEKSLIS